MSYTYTLLPATAPSVLTYATRLFTQASKAGTTPTALWPSLATRAATVVSQSATVAYIRETPDVKP